MADGYIYFLKNNVTQKIYVGQAKGALNAPINSKHRMYQHYVNAINNDLSDASISVFKDAVETKDIELYIYNRSPFGLPKKKTQYLKDRWSGANDDLAWYLDVSEIAHIAHLLPTGQLLNREPGGQHEYFYNFTKLINKASLTKEEKDLLEKEMNKSHKSSILFHWGSFGLKEKDGIIFLNPDSYALSSLSSLNFSLKLQDTIQNLLAENLTITATDSVINIIQGNKMVKEIQQRTRGTVVKNREKITNIIKTLYINEVNKWNQKLKKMGLIDYIKTKNDQVVTITEQDFAKYGLTSSNLEKIQQDIFKNIQEGKVSDYHITYPSFMRGTKMLQKPDLPEWVDTLKLPTKQNTTLLKRCAITYFQQAYEKNKGEWQLCSKMRSIYKNIPHIYNNWYNFYDEEMAVMQKINNNYGGLAFEDIMINDMQTNIPVAAFYRKKSQPIKTLFTTKPAIADNIVEIDRRIKRKSDITIY